jgi:hypothetical protein
MLFFVGGKRSKKKKITFSGMFERSTPGVTSQGTLLFLVVVVKM